jgi:hypothetical protein
MQFNKGFTVIITVIILYLDTISARDLDKIKRDKKPRLIKESRYRKLTGMMNIFLNRCVNTTIIKQDLSVASLLTLVLY